MTLNLHTCNYMYTLSSFEAYETFPVEITRAHARKHLTRARARCASKDRRARETREQRQTRARGARASRASTARARRAYLRARRAYVSLFARARACPKCARLSLLAHLARARVKCSRARAAHPAAGEAPYMNSYVLNQANVYMSYLYDWHMFTIWLYDHLYYYSKWSYLIVFVCNHLFVCSGNNHMLVSMRTVPSSSICVIILLAIADNVYRRTYV